MKIAILTDTKSGIIKKTAQEMVVFVITMPVIIDDETFFEGENITEAEFYDALQKGKKITTSQPSPGSVLEMWEELLESGYEQIVYIPMTSGLSKSCETAMGLAKSYEGRVFVVDNHRISVPLKESVLAALKMADAGMSGDKIKASLEETAYHCSIYIMVETLEYLKKGGRITPAAAMIGSVLNIKPVLTIQGEKLDSFAKVRGTKKGHKVMIEAIRRDLETRFAGEDLTHLRIATAGANLTEEQIADWKASILQEFPGAEVYYDPLSVSIGSHTGPGATGIGISFDKF